MNILPLYLPQQGCKQQCVYCNQPLTVGATDERSRWDERLRILDQCNPRGEWEIAFYGGTFSALPREVMNECLDQAEPYWRSGRSTGVRISTRPDAVDDETLTYLSSRGVRVIELGVESFDDGVLRRSGRGHSAQCAIEACLRVRERGFQLGIHLMTGLPKQSVASWRETVAQTLDLSPAMVRIAPTLVLRDTPLERLYRRGVYSPQPLEEAIQQCAYAYARFHRAGVAIARVGLALSDENSDGAEKVVAGPWHPALRQEVESLLAFRALTAAWQRDPGVKAAINPRDESIVFGQRKRNLAAWTKLFGETPAILRDPALPRYTFRLGDGEQKPLFAIDEEIDGDEHE